MTRLLGALALLALAAAAPLPAQAGRALAGRVTDAAGAPLADATVRLPELARTATTDADGRVRLAGLPQGSWLVSVARVGFRPQHRRVTLAEAGETPLEVALEAAVVELEALQVTATVLPTAILDAPQAVTTLDAEALRQARAPSLGETLGQVPGTQNSSTGPGIGRPVVRGLTGNRVLVVADGQRLEFQQWGEEHAPSLEVQDAAAVEIVRGPASVLYGSDALGGVVNVVARPLPDASGGAPALRGRASVGLNGNNGAPDATVALEGAAGALGWRALAGAQRGGDLRTPSGPLRNSGYETAAGQGTLGASGAWGRAQLMVAHKAEAFRVAEDPAVDPAYTGRQQVRTTRIRGEGVLPAGRHRVELGVGLERNRRREYAAATDADVTTGLAADLLTADARFLHGSLGPLDGAAGFTFSRLAFTGSGREPFLPDYQWWNVGAYAFEQVRLGAVQLAAGLRLDHRALTAEADAALGVEGQTRRWTALSGNAGVTVRVARDVALVGNLGRGFRAPQAPELFANGVHEGTLAYEIGNPALGVERSWNVDAGVRWFGERVRGELNVFRNQVDGFIYYRPTGEREPRTGLEIFRFVQGEALLTGFEASLTWRPLHALELSLGADATRGTNRSLDTPLPFMPPLRALYGARWLALPVPGLPRATGWAGVRGETMTRQRRPDVDEVAPPGFTRIDLEGGVTLPGPAGEFTLDVALRNVGNVAHVRPLNRFKGFAREMGRHLVVRAGVPF